MSGAPARGGQTTHLQFAAQGKAAQRATRDGISAGADHLPPVLRLIGRPVISGGQRGHAALGPDACGNPRSVGHAVGGQGSGHRAAGRRVFLTNPRAGDRFWHPTLAKSTDRVVAPRIATPPTTDRRSPGQPAS